MKRSDSILEKIIRLSIENTTKIRHVEDSYCELYSHDKNNGAFEFEISKGTLTNENVVALFKFLRSGSYWKTNGTVEDNKIKFNFDTSLITQNEEVVCYIYLDKEERNSDIFRFKFKVNLSEIDKASQLPEKERFFANSMIVDRVDVLTKEDFDKAIKEIEKGSKFLTEAQANEKYALKGDIPNVSNLVSNTQLSDYALKTEIPNSETIVNKAVEEVEKKGYLTEHQSLANYVTETQLNDKNFLTQHQDISKLATKQAVDDVAAKVTQLENRPVTSSYDDSEIKREIKELKDRPVTANIDTSNFVTTTQLEDKHYLTQHQDISGLATKEQLDELRNSQPTVDNLVTKEQLRKAFLNEEGQEKYVDLDTFVSATRGVLGSSTNEKGVEEYFNEVTTGLSEEAKETYIGDIYKNATETKVYRKNGFTNFKDMMYTLAKIFPDNYNYKDENQRVDILTNRNYQEYIKSSGNVDTNDFATKKQIENLQGEISFKLNTADSPFYFTGFNNAREYSQIVKGSKNDDTLYGRVFVNANERKIYRGHFTFTELDLALYTLAKAIPEGYTPDYEFGDSDNIELITNKTIQRYLPTNTGNTGNTTELDKRLKVIEAKQWEIHGRGMPNGVVTAPVGTTYVDEAVTNGALKWIKKSGTGNTGWEVLIGDTGWKILPSVSKLGNSFVKIRRVNNIVSYQFGGLSWGWFGIVRRGGAGYVLQGSDRERNCYIIQNGGIPIGYRAEASLIGNIYNDKGVSYGTWYLGGNGDYNQLRFQFTDPVPTDRDIGDIRISSISYLTNEPWPQN
jgi:hypothetical protein|nr:MAG TPA: hypothetical protein [Caudoviricetes sp.]